MASNGSNDTHANLHEDLKAAAAELNECDGAGVTYANAGNCYNCPLHQKSLDSFTSNSSDVNRHKLANAAEKVLISARDPKDQWIEHSIDTGRLAAIHLFQAWGGFAHIPENVSISITELAQKLDAEPSLIERILGILTFSPPNLIAHTPRSLAFLPSNPFNALHALMWNNATTPFFHFEDYFSTYGHKEPQKENHISATFAPGCLEKPFFAWLAGQPGYFGRFIKGMEMIERETRVSERYDFGWLVEKAEREEGERAVFVDFGWGKGHAIVAIREEFPELPVKRFVLEDRPETIEAVEREGVKGLEGVCPFFALVLI